MDLTDIKSWSELKHDLLQFLREEELMAYYNMGCYSNKEEYKNQYAKELYKVELIELLRDCIFKHPQMKNLAFIPIVNNELTLTDSDIKAILTKDNKFNNKNT